MQYNTYDEYWLAYLAAHRKPLTRLFHYVGTIISLLIGTIVLATLGWKAWVLVGLAGYSILFASHFVFEGNRPFGKKPLLSLYSDLRMMCLETQGKLQIELERLD